MSHESLQILVCQHGARRRYAMARMLQEAGMLAGLYTDSSALSSAGYIAGILGKAAPHSLRRLARRKIEGIPPEKIVSSDAALFRELLQQACGRRRHGMPLYLQRHRILSAAMIRRGLQNADAVYSMYYENLDFIRWAKQQGAKSIVDVYISPLTDDVMNEEKARFREWARDTDSDDAGRVREQLWREAADLADVLICPSEWVARGVRSKTPDAAAKIRIVPYGSSIDYAGRSNVPEAGRILFAGGDALRKGLRHLAEAATFLRTVLPSAEVRVAGLLPDEVVHHPVCRDLRFLGKLSTDQMKQEFLSADLFVLPSLSEGFAGVVAEAIRAGCPVVTTIEAGAPIVHEREGLIVPAGDAAALQAALVRMVQDRGFRDACSAACLANASFYSREAWKARLVSSIEDALA